ncbi:MAG: hypothetical protein HC906_09375, partial [Bacteroidales bacterium]|nr:hypothetical protein [Bacteroidales bacterium]
MGYYIDLASLSLDEYSIKLSKGYLPPSRMILKERIDERMGYFKSIGINNVYELIQYLKKKEKFNALSNVKCLDQHYLTILLRE